MAIVPLGRCYFMIDRTEELGLSAQLPLSVGGKQVVLRTLNLDESESWQRKFAEFEIVPDSATAGRTTDAMLELVQAYDVDGALGPDLRKRFTRRELYDAVKAMARAELPFLADQPSADAAFGGALAGLLIAAQFQSESSPNGHSPSGESAPTPSAADGSPKNGSSSTGPTARKGSDAKRPSRATSKNSP